MTLSTAPATATSSGFRVSAQQQPNFAFVSKSDIASARAIRQAGGKLPSWLVADVSQGVARNCCKSGGLAISTPTTSSEFIVVPETDISEAKVLTPAEVLSLQGWPPAQATIPQELTTTDLRTLFGNMQCVPTVGAILMALLKSVPLQRLGELRAQMDARTKPARS